MALLLLLIALPLLAPFIAACLKLLMIGVIAVLVTTAAGLAVWRWACPEPEGRR